MYVCHISLCCQNKNTSGKNSTWYVLSSMVHYMIVQKNYSKRVEEEYFRILSLLKDNYPNNYVYTSFIFPKSTLKSRYRRPKHGRIRSDRCRTYTACVHLPQKNFHHERFHVWFPKLKSISSQNSKYCYPNNNKAL